MRLLVVTSLIDRSEAALYAGLAANGIEVELVCDPRATRRELAVNAGIPVSELNVRHRLDFAAARTIRERLQQRHFDVIYAPFNRGLSVALMAARGHPAKIVAYRGTIGHLSRWDPASHLTYLHPRLSCTVCVSEAVRRYLLSLGIPPQHAVTVHKGHDLAWYDALQPVPRAELGLPEKTFVAGFVGGIRRIKGVDVLLRAVIRARRQHDIHVLLVGPVTDRRVARLLRAPALNGVVHLAGYRPDGAATMTACDVFVMPSVGREGLPRAVIEATAQRVPAIVSDVGGMPELVADGETGYVVPPGDPEALAAALSRLAEDRDECHRLGAAARARIAARFNITDTIDAYTALFTDLCAGA